MIKKHLEDSHTSYSEHLRWAVLAGFRLIWAGIASLIHAVHPGLFPGTAARTVIDLYYSRLHNHPNGEYKDFIDEFKHKK